MSSIETNNDSQAPYPAHTAGYGPANREKGVLNVNKALGVLVGGALVAGVVLAAASTGRAQIAGEVFDNVGAPVPNARVEVWDAYPGGSVLTFGATDAQGGFSLSSVPPVLFDLRVIKPVSGVPEYYPTVIRGLPDPITNVLAFLFPVGTTLSSMQVCEYWDTSSTFLGAKLRPGDMLEAFDPDGVLCGLALSNGNGHFNITVIGDDGLPDGIDEGPFNGELVDFTINGFPATPPAVFADLGVIKQHLTGATSSHGVTVIGPVGANGAPGELALISYQVTNSGSTADSFTVSASLPEGWPITYPTAKLPSLVLAPGASANVDILVQVPPGVADITVHVSFIATSRTYSIVQAGATTDLSVRTTGVWDGGDGGLLPSRFSLAQNYPNPFNPETEIAFNLRVEGHVRLEVFNILGQSVAVLADGYRPQGITVAHWDGRDARGAVVPTGIYFYRLTQDSQSFVRKMVLLK